MVHIYAASVILPITTIGYMLMCLVLFFKVPSHLHVDLLLWPTCVFLTSWLLWHKYQESGWRRNLDILVTAISVSYQSLQTYHSCACPYHYWMYFAFCFSGFVCYALGWVAWDVRNPQLGMKWHMGCHIVGYFCNMVLFSCCGEGADSIFKKYISWGTSTTTKFSTSSAKSTSSLVLNHASILMEKVSKWWGEIDVSSSNTSCMFCSNCLLWSLLGVSWLILACWALRNGVSPPRGGNNEEEERRRVGKWRRLLQRPPYM